MITPVKSKNVPAAVPGKTKNRVGTGLKQGQIIKGTVIERLKDGEFIISSGGKDFRAHSALALRQGEIYDFYILSAKGRVEIRVLEEEPPVTGNISGAVTTANAIGHKLVHALSSVIHFPSIKTLPTQVSGLINKLQEILKHPFSARDIRQAVSWVTKNINGSGIFWEAKLLHLITGKKDQAPKEMADQDIKAILLNILKGVEKNQEQREGGVISFSASVRDALGFIEQEQIMNLDTVRDDIGWFVNLPFVNREDFLASGLFIKKTGKGGLHFSMFLDMSLAGKMNIDILFFNETASVMMHVENQRTRELILENAHELEGGFKKAGIMTGAIRCEVKEDIIPSESAIKTERSDIDLII
ncbi:MAG: flagellar hook-length control protein FliK [Deltaproteobacteria bacterium]|jgi:hypothetical protein|nr:flagellar hook-length control protein FliK [Deltaproteobacteria bacterium]